MSKQSTNQEKVYERPLVLSHQSITFETSQSWNKGHGPVSGDQGNSNGNNYPHEPYPDKKEKPEKPNKNK